MSSFVMHIHHHIIVYESEEDELGRECTEWSRPRGTAF
jgi:hypothetical protein